jgi:hypothetical protein
VLPVEDDVITLQVKVTRTGWNGYGTGDTITVRIPGYPLPVTIAADYLNKVVEARATLPAAPTCDGTG